MSLTPIVAVLFLSGTAPQESIALRQEVGRLKAQVALLSAALQERDDLLVTVRQEMDGVRSDVRGLREHPPRDLAAAFLAGPATGSDRLGVARAAVFAPRIEVDSSRRHDTIFLTVKRVETSAVETIARLELTPDLEGIDLPLDDSGALYVVDWQTSWGHVFNLVLRDGASGQPAASVPVQERQEEGRFAFVGYRVE
jgi:hypothetical protein